MSDVAERVKKIVVEHLGVDAEKVTENASLLTISAPTASIRSNS
jgi:acyl carrier protein